MPGRVKRNSTTAPARWSGAVAAAGWLLIAVATLTPAAQDETPPFGCIICGPAGGIDAIANAVLFGPLGAGLALRRSPAWRALALIAPTTLAVELLQLRLVAGRDTSLGDLVWNVVGGACGYWAIRGRGQLLRRAPGLAAALAALWAALWTGGSARAAWSLAPAMPLGRWAAHVGAPERAPGVHPVVLAAAIGEERLRTGWVANPARLRARIIGGEPASVRAVLPAGTAAAANLLVVDNGRTEEVMLAMGRAGDGASFYLRTRVGTLRLRSPTLTLPGVVAPGGDTVEIEAARRAATVELAGGSPRRTAGARVAPGPNWGWSLLLPTGLSRLDRFGTFTALWVACLVAPIGYWSAQARNGHRAAHAGALAALAAPPAAFLLLPPAFGLAAAGLTDWGAWLAATALALGAGLRAARGGPRSATVAAKPRAV